MIRAQHGKILEQDFNASSPLNRGRLISRNPCIIQVIFLRLLRAASVGCTFEVKVVVVYQHVPTSTNFPGRHLDGENDCGNDFSDMVTALVRYSSLPPVAYCVDEFDPENFWFTNTLSLLKIRARHTKAQHICLRRVFTIRRMSHSYGSPLSVEATQLRMNGCLNITFIMN